MENSQKRVFITGSTGFMGLRLIPELQKRGYAIDALVRPGSVGKLPPGTSAIVGDAVNPSTYAKHLTPGHIFVQLAGVTHPGPLKKDLFKTMDYVAGSEAVRVAAAVGIKHFVYLSVVQPAPIMKSYVEARAAVESLLRSSGMNVCILRPWYVLGPGRRWPLFLRPLYWLMKCFSATKAEAERLEFLTERQMTAALVDAVENRPSGIRIYEVKDMIRL